jgi:hypothetical protein
LRGRSKEGSEIIAGVVERRGRTRDHCGEERKVDGGGSEIITGGSRKERKEERSLRGRRNGVGGGKGQSRGGMVRRRRKRDHCWGKGNRWGRGIIAGGREGGLVVKGCRDCLHLERI